MILHICTNIAWEDSKTKASYEGDTLTAQGFIHCSTPDQAIEVAGHLFKGQTGLVLLVIDDSKVIPEIKYEDAGNGKLYPHIYGPLNIDAVIKVMGFPPKPDGTFELPNLNY